MPKTKDKIFYSNARWSKISNTRDMHCNSYDAEKNKQFAFSMCRGLIDRYRKGKECNIRGECLKTWVTDSNGVEVSHE